MYDSDKWRIEASVIDKDAYNADAVGNLEKVLDYFVKM